jgi:hypothetical protein
MKAYLGSGGIVPGILDLGTRWRWVVIFTFRPLYPWGKSPYYPLDRRLGEPPNRCGRGGKEINSQLEPRVIHPVAQRYTTEISRIVKGRKVIINWQLYKLVIHLCE